MSAPWPEAILLDFYGTVVEEDDVPIQRICEAISRASTSSATPADIDSYWGQIFGQLCSESFGATFKTQKALEQLSLERVLHHFGDDLDPDALSQPLYEYWAHPSIFPESESILTKCELPVCLVSDIDNAELRSAMEHNDLEFDWIVTSEDCRAYKPRGEIFAKALSILELQARRVLHVGDSLTRDVRGAKAQGIPVLWINRKGRRLSGSDETPDYESTDLTGLLAIVGGGEGTFRQSNTHPQR